MPGSDEHRRYADYLKDRHPLSYPYRQRLLYPRYRKWLALPAGGSGLEIGCGLGEFLQGSPGYAGVDYDPQLVAICVERGLPVTVGNASDTGKAGGAYGAVLLDNVLEHLDEPDACFAEIVRVLKPGGRALIAVPNANGYRRDDTHVKLWDETNLPDAVRAAGLGVRKHKHDPIPSKWLGNAVWPFNTFVVLAEKPA